MVTGTNMAKGWTQDAAQFVGKDSWAFEALKELLVQERGLDLEAYKESCIYRRIFLRVRSSGYESLGSYYRALVRDPEELDRLFQYLTIHVTEFFRNPVAYDYLKRRILPKILLESRNAAKLRIWSVGCSSGEEPYSLAMLMLKARAELGVSTPFKILATDIDETILEKGKKGYYSGDSLKNVESKDLVRYFVQEGDGYQVREELAKVISFRQANVLTDRPGHEKNLIVCRNLLIYLSRVRQEKVIKRFADFLVPSGYLMLGKAETLIGQNRIYFHNISPSERIYRKREVPLEIEET